MVANRNYKRLDKSGDCMQFEFSLVPRDIKLYCDWLM